MSTAAATAAPFDPTALSDALPLPLYLQLARHLRTLIVEGRLTDQDALPGERELAETFGVSRVTVRKALRELIAEGLLHQRQGAGTFINRSPHVEQRLSTLTSFTEDIGGRGLKPDSRWLSRSAGTATPEEAMALGLSPGAEVVRLHRLRLADGTPLAIELSALPASFLPDPEMVQGSLYETLRGRGHPPFRALQRLSAIRLPADQAALLGVPDGAPALYIERRTFLENGTPLEFVRSHYRGDAYDFVVELSLA